MWIWVSMVICVVMCCCLVSVVLVLVVCCCVGRLMRFSRLNDSCRLVLF